MRERSKCRRVSCAERDSAAERGAVADDHAAARSRCDHHAAAATFGVAGGYRDIRFSFPSIVGVAGRDRLSKCVAIGDCIRIGGAVRFADRNSNANRNAGAGARA